MRAADAAGVVLAVGHSERFNPAVHAALAVVREPRFIEVHRLSSFPERSLDIDVVFDVMIHDLDIILAMDGSDVVEVEAVGVPVLTPRVDIANARVKFASGCIANLTASRISREQVRKFRCFQRDMYVSVDYAAQELEVWRLQPNDGSAAGDRGRRGARRARRAAAARDSRISSAPILESRRAARVSGGTAGARWPWRRAWHRPSTPKRRRAPPRIHSDAARVIAVKDATHVP